MSKATFNRAELDAALRLRPHEKEAMRNALRQSVLRIYTAEFEPVPEVEAVVDELVSAFEVGRGRQIREKLSTVMLQIATACIGPPPELKSVVDGIFRTYEDGYTQAGALLVSAEKQAVQLVLKAVEHVVGSKEAAAGTLRLMGAYRMAQQSREALAASEALREPVREFVKALWDRTTDRKERLMKNFQETAIAAVLEEDRRRRANREKPDWPVRDRAGEKEAKPSPRTIAEWIKHYKAEKSGE